MDKRRIIGIGRLIIDPDQKGEFAVLVHDDFQGKGLGYKLLDMVIGVALDKNLDEVHGLVLKENEKFLSMVTRLGFTILDTPEDEAAWRVQLPLR